MDAVRTFETPLISPSAERLSFSGKGSQRLFAAVPVSRMYTGHNKWNARKPKLFV